MDILFIGESWQGSCARSLKEALERRDDVRLENISEEEFFPRPRARAIRALNRLAGAAYRRRFASHVLTRVEELRPQVVMAYKGNPVHADLAEAIGRKGILTVNVYPDCSPHAHGIEHRAAVGAYHLVISTKPFHPQQWATTYGYRNRCVFVPQGYDPALHLVREPCREFAYDVAMVATYRAEYGRLAVELGQALGDADLRVAIGGNGWEKMRSRLPRHWTFPGPVQGPGYVSLLRRARICVAPVTRQVEIDGRVQPGDLDSTRTYELAAAHCFFIHRRTDYARSLYGEGEVPMFDTARELAELIRRYLGRDDERERMAAAAHRRAVPAYSMDERARQIAAIVASELRAAGAA
jgi:glycosyltransferase involved in cell wall biosynthesis